MKIIKISALHDYIRKHPRTRSWIENWVSDVRNSEWNTPHDIKSRYARTSVLRENIIYFDVCGNQHRLEVLVAYKAKKVFVRWIGTHDEYMRRMKADRRHENQGY